MAGPVADAAQRAETLFSEGKGAEGFEALDAAVEAAWSAGPLVIRKVLRVDESSGFGRYVEHSGSEITTDDRLVLYVEPVGYSFGTSGQQSTIALAVDLSLQNTTGQELVAVKDLFTVRSEALTKQREFSMEMRHPIPYLRPGDYKGVYTVRDLNSAKSASFEMPFTVVLGGATPVAPEAPATPQ